MEANELRIGNLVIATSQRHNESFIKVKSIGIEFINDDFRPYNLQEISGIGLNRYWLLKFQFELRGFGCQKIVNDLYTIVYDSEGISIFVENQSDNYYCTKIILPAIKYVHQLQNLFYSLTGNDIELV